MREVLVLQFRFGKAETDGRFRKSAVSMIIIAVNICVQAYSGVSLDLSDLRYEILYISVQQVLYPAAVDTDVSLDACPSLVKPYVGICKDRHCSDVRLEVPYGNSRD